MPTTIVVPTIGELIQHYREQSGMSRHHLARIIGVSLNVPGMYERNQFLPTHDRLRRIAQALHVPLSCFLPDDPTAQPEDATLSPPTTRALHKHVRQRSAALCAKAEALHTRSAAAVAKAHQRRTAPVSDRS